MVGGFNPIENYKPNWKSSPNRGEHKKYMKPPPSIWVATTQISIVSTSLLPGFFRMIQSFSPPTHVSHDPRPPLPAHVNLQRVGHGTSVWGGKQTCLKAHDTKNHGKCRFFKWTPKMEGLEYVFSGFQFQWVLGSMWIVRGVCLHPGKLRRCFLKKDI